MNQNYSRRRKRYGAGRERVNGRETGISVKWG